MMLLVGCVLAARTTRAADTVSASGWLDGLAVVPTESDSQRQRPELMGTLRLDAAPQRWLHGRLELRGRVGGPFEGGPGPGVWNFDQTFQNRSPSLDVNEGWVELRATKAELRLGIQTVAWGKLDGIPPTDVINPRDFHDPIVQDAEERKIGIPAALGTWYLPDVERFDLSGLRASLVYVPIAVPPRLALVEERWFPSSIGVKPRLPLSATNSIAVNFGTANDTPARSLKNGGIGARFTGTWRGSDWDVYHYTGPETGPDGSLIPVIFQKSPTSAPIAIARLTQEHDTIHMTGADLAFPIGGFTVRAEGAWFVNRPYLRPANEIIDPVLNNKRRKENIFDRVANRGLARVQLQDLFLDLDSVEWGIGADYLWHGFQPIIQLNQIVLLEDAPELLIGQPDTRLLATIRKQLLDDRLELEFRSVYQIEKGAWFVMPRISYLVRDDFRVRLAYLAIGGPRDSLIGQFRANDEVVFQARYSF
jgi:hypothetical protein